jgi:2-hydroxy-6-oxonona-2,4-dienedioate hydrolase
VTPLVLVHGLMGGSRQWQAQIEAMTGVACIALDLPGFGENAQRESLCDICGFADWALDTLGAQGITQFHLLGHSMGGMVAQQMVALAPERVASLVLYGTGAQGVLPGRFETIETSKARAQADGAQATARRIAATWFLEREKAPAYPLCAQIAQASSMEAILGGLDAMNGWSGTAHLAQIAAPTLVVCGDHDRTYSWEQTQTLWRGIAGADLAVLPRCSHAAHLEKPALFNAILDDFLGAQSSGRMISNTSRTAV